MVLKQIRPLTYRDSTNEKIFRAEQFRLIKNAEPPINKDAYGFKYTIYIKK